MAKAIGDARVHNRRKPRSAAEWQRINEKFESIKKDRQMLMDVVKPYCKPSKGSVAMDGDGEDDQDAMATNAYAAAFASRNAR